MKHKIIARFKVGDQERHHQRQDLDKRSRFFDRVMADLDKKEAISRVKESIKINDDGSLVYSGSGTAADIKEAFKR